MSRFKKQLPFLILTLLVYGWYFFTHQPAQHKKLNVLGANTAIQLFIEPEAGDSPVIQEINSAQKEILVEVYILSDKDVISALDAAQNRGVSVKVMLEEHPFGGGDLNTKTAKTLQEDGIAYKWTSPVFALTHEKSIVIDNSEVFVLSQNLSASSFSKNREYDVLDRNPKDVSEVRSIFIADWERQSFTPSQTNLIVSPVNSRDAIVSLFESASVSIDTEVEDIDDAEIIDVLSEKAKKMPVRLILPTLKQISSNADAIQTLRAAGVKVETLSSPYIHGKMIVVDGQKAYIGSVNFSTQSLDKNRELGIILTQPEAIQALETTFQQDWEKGLQ